MAKADLISIPCRRGLFQYLHFGIDIGDGTVVHLATEAMATEAMGTEAMGTEAMETGVYGTEMSVQRVLMERFANGQPVMVESVSDPLPPDEVVRGALDAVGTRGYHLVLGNCEHFARKLKTGRVESVQVEMCWESVVRAAVASIASTARRHVIAKSIAIATQSRFLVAAGSLVPTIAGETARHGVYAVGRRCQMSHADAQKSSRAAGHAACALGGLVVGGPVGSAGALAISIATERMVDAWKRSASPFDSTSSGSMDSAGTR